MSTDAVEKLLEVLAPFAALADVCRHFRKDDATAICRWRIAGEPYRGPTVAQVKKAREVFDAVAADLPAGNAPEIRSISEIVADALRAEARLLLAYCTESQQATFNAGNPGGVEVMDRKRLEIAIVVLQRLVALNVKVARAGAA
jgi:hypothetical protein